MNNSRGIRLQEERKELLRERERTLQVQSEDSSPGGIRLV